MQTINVRKAINIQLWALIAIYLVLLSLSLDKLNWGDDAYYTEVADTRPILEWWWERYLSWSGRIVIDLLTVATFNLSWLWHIAIPATVLLLAYSMVRLVGWQVTPTKLVMVLVLFAISPAKVMAESFYWVTGFYNYLLPTALALFCFSEVSSSEKRPMWCSVVATLAVLIFAYQEQVTILFCLALVLSIYQERTSFKWFILAFTLLNSSLLFLAPGNANRLLASTFMYFPNFDDFGLFHKVLLGMDKLYQVFVMPDNWPLALLLTTLVMLSVSQAKCSLAERISMAIIICYLASFFLQNQYVANLNTPLLQFDYTGIISAEAVSDGDTYVAYLVMLLVMSSTLTLLFGLIKHIENGTLVFWSLLLGVSSVMMLGFSPTVYASNYRVQMLFEIGVILALLYTWSGVNWQRLNGFKE